MAGGQGLDIVARHILALGGAFFVRFCPRAVTSAASSRGSKMELDNTIILPVWATFEGTLVPALMSTLHRGPVFLASVIARCNPAAVPMGLSLSNSIRMVGLALTVSASAIASRHLTYRRHVCVSSARRQALTSDITQAL